MLIVDAHQDLAYNILTFRRDYTRPVQETRRLEAGTQTPQRNGNTLLGWPQYQLGRIGLVFSTLFAAPLGKHTPSWETLAYADYEEAHVVYNAQVEAYYRLVDDHPDHFRLVLDKSDLEAVLRAWERPEPEEHAQAEDGNSPQGRVGNPVGLVMLMEGAEGVRHPGELEAWWEKGVRFIGLAWMGTRFCGGTRQPGPLTPDGYALLEGMSELGFGLDISHMDEAAVLQALEVYPGPILASHSNAWSLVRTDTNRHLSDRVIRGLIEREGVIGINFYNAFLKAGWRNGDPRQEVTLQHIVAQIDYICQMAGNAAYIGLGSDFDGGLGWESVPAEIDTVADLAKLAPMLLERGYTEEDITLILNGNWLRMLRRVLPTSS